MNENCCSGKKLRKNQINKVNKKNLLRSENIKGALIFENHVSYMIILNGLSFSINCETMLTKLKTTTSIIVTFSLILNKLPICVYSQL